MRTHLVFLLINILCITWSNGQDEGSFGSFWHNNAHFEFLANCSFPTPGEPQTETGNVGTYFTIVGETWYLFYREIHYELTPAACKLYRMQALLIYRYFIFF